MKAAFTSSKFDPRKLGALCDACPLKDQIPVPPRVNRKARLIIVGEGPGPTEEIEQEPFVGASGQLLDTCNQLVGIPKSQTHVSNALLCRSKVKLSPADWKKALACCRPRLNKELQKVKTTSVIVALGARAQQALTGRAKIFDWMLSPYAGAPPFERFTVISALHPAHVLRNPEWRPALLIGLDRAWRAAQGFLPAWRWPPIRYEGTAAIQGLKQILKEGLPIGLDVETGGVSISSKLLNVGVASVSVAVSVQWATCSDIEKQLMKQILLDQRLLKVLHNGQFDIRVLRKNALEVANYGFDTIHSAAILAPKLKRGLTIVAALEYHAPRWKSEFRISSDSSGAARFLNADPIERAIYNAKDAFMTLLIYLSHVRKLDAEHNGRSLLQEMMQLNQVAIRMATVGIATDRKNFEGHVVRLSRKRSTAKRELAELARTLAKSRKRYEQFFGAQFKPGSADHIRNLFEQLLHVTPRAFSELTQRSRYDDKVLADLCAHQGLTARAARLVRTYRKSHKLLKTYVLNLPIDSDGRVRANWNPSGAKTGRWACSEPNLQNIAKAVYRKLKNGKLKLEYGGLRDLYKASRGKYLVEVDYQRLEAWIIAYLSNDKELLRLLAEADLHTETAKWFFTTQEPSKAERDMAKILRYAWQYGALPATAWKQAVPDFPDLALSTVERIFLELNKRHPDVKRWHKLMLKGARENDYVEIALGGIRWYFHGVVEPSTVFNVPVQGFAARLINKALLRIMPRLRSGDEILLQVHDSLVGESTDPKGLLSIIREEMERPIQLGPVTIQFRTDSKLGRNWGNLEAV